MAAEKQLEKCESVATGSQSVSLTSTAKQDGGLGKDGIPSDSSTFLTPGSAASSNKGETSQESIGEHGVYYPPTSCYNYYFYPGYNGSFPAFDGYVHTDGSFAGMQSDDGSMVYYVPGYNSYTSGNFVGVDGSCGGQQQYLSSSGYLQPPVSYGSEALPCYSWDSTLVGDCQAGNPTSFNVAKSGGSIQVASVKSNGSNVAKANGNFSSKISKSFSNTQPLKPLNKVPHLAPDFSAGLMKGFQPAGKFSSFGNQRQSPLQQYGHMNYRPNGRIWNGNDKFKLRDRFNKNGDYASAAELTRGPRTYNNKNASNSAEKDYLGLSVCRDDYNLPDFQIEYDNAKFYVIKSYSEDDVHKCIKYDVWTSTPNGNKKLEKAFHDAEQRESEMGTRCPVFLFFSVNGSGQFVGCAEMIGHVDFNKSMNFWQLDKWNGFFPVKWHIIKDIPNVQLRHIILENNENKAVTYSRDTQEIGLEQGLEMLKIFKNYSSKTSLLDDFNFYEDREKSLQVKKTSKPSQIETNKSMNTHKHAKGGERNIEVETAEDIVNLTKSLTLDANQMKTAVKISTENIIPSA